MLIHLLILLLQVLYQLIIVKLSFNFKRIVTFYFFQIYIFQCSKKPNRVLLIIIFKNYFCLSFKKLLTYRTLQHFLNIMFLLQPQTCQSYLTQRYFYMINCFTRVKMLHTWLTNKQNTLDLIFVDNYLN